jgi:hypothetical protein
VCTKSQKFTKEFKEAIKNVKSEKLIFTNAMQSMSDDSSIGSCGLALNRIKAIDSLARSSGFTKPSQFEQCKAMTSKIFCSNTQPADFTDCCTEKLLQFKKISRANLF